MLIFRSSLLLPFLAVVSLEHQASCKAGQEWKFPSDYPARHHATALVSVDPRNVVTTTELDDWERPTRVTVTGGETPLEEWFEYDAVGRLRSHRRRQGAEIVTSEFRYDAMHRRIESSTDNAQVGGATATVKSTTNYQISARRIVATLTGGATVTTTLDRLGRIESRRTETGHSPIDALFAYDASDNPVYNSDRLTASAMAFDIHGRLVGTLYSDGTREETEYDAWDRATAMRALDEAGEVVAEQSAAFTPAGKLTETSSKRTSRSSAISRGTAQAARPESARSCRLSTIPRDFVPHSAHSTPQNG